LSPVFATLLTSVLLVTPQGPDLAAELARAVDLPTATERRAAADALAAKNLAPLEAWRTACASFGTFAPLEPGPSRHKVELRLPDEVVTTEAFLFVPKGYDVKKPAPLLLWGHGAGGTGAREYLHWEAVADQVGMLVLAITAIEGKPGYHFSPRERAAQLAALRWARRQANVDENAIFVGGWSQGGHQAWDLALRHPDRFAGLLPVVGGPRLEIGPKNNLRYLDNVVHLPIVDLQGSRDDLLLLTNLRLAFARLQKAGAKQATLHEFPELGHSAELDAVDWPPFFAQRRTSRPTRVVRTAAEPTETRAFWAEISGLHAAARPEAQPTVSASFASLDDAGQRSQLLDRYATVTARLQVDDKGGGRFIADGKLVTAFTLWLEPEQLGKDGAVEVRWQNKPVKKVGKAEVAVLLGEFVERFDRTFLPVAKVQVP
jgi:dienelactone hydrolase